METIWLNLGMAAIWWWVGEDHWPVLLPVAIVIFLYSLAHDWHEDAAAYREALDELAALDASDSDVKSS